MLFVKIIICLHTFRQGSREEILEPAAHFNNNVSKLGKFKLTVFQTKCLLVSHEEKSCTGLFAINIIRLTVICQILF